MDINFSRWTGWNSLLFTFQPFSNFSTWALDINVYTYYTTWHRNRRKTREIREIREIRWKLERTIVVTIWMMLVFFYSLLLPNRIQSKQTLGTFVRFLHRIKSIYNKQRGRWRLEDVTIEMRDKWEEGRPSHIRRSSSAAASASADDDDCHDDVDDDVHLIIAIVTVWGLDESKIESKNKRCDFHCPPLLINENVLAIIVDRNKKKKKQKQNKTRDVFFSRTQSTTSIIRSGIRQPPFFKIGASSHPLRFNRLPTVIF